jgi:uncharacterized phage protein (TIGR01671 family)
MRAIKFRAWDKKEKEMISHNRLFRLDTSNELPFLPLLEKFKDEYEVMEHTGLTDKNGKEIYEKDVVDFDGKKYMVTFANGGFGIWKEIRTDLYSDETRDYYEPLWNLILDGCEVIGNLFENPELLEGKNHEGN